MTSATGMCVALERYWKSDMDNDKIAAYLTLYEALVIFIKMAAPFVPFIPKSSIKIWFSTFPMPCQYSPL